MTQQEVGYQGGVQGGGDPQATCKEQACGRPAPEAGRTCKAGDRCCWMKGLLTSPKARAPVGSHRGEAREAGGPWWSRQVWAFPLGLGNQ